MNTTQIARDVQALCDENDALRRQVAQLLRERHAHDGTSRPEVALAPVARIANRGAQGAKKAHPIHGLHFNRVRSNPIEVSCAKLWNQWCSGMNAGFSVANGILDQLCSDQEGRPLMVLDDSHRAVAATVVQWMGTNVGRGFLQEAFRDAGFTLSIESEPRLASSAPSRRAVRSAL